MNNDLISRSKAIAAVERREPLLIGDKLVSTDSLKNFLRNRPSVDAEPVRHGRWLNKGYITTAYGSIDTGDCSACGAVDVPIEPYDYYCPNCGARMDGGGHE